MPYFLFLFALAFALLPFDSQIALIGLLRSIPSEIWLGAFGASLAAMFWYSAGWNGLAGSLYHEDMSKAEDALKKRRR
jgi:hypothetical protein